MTFEDTAFLEVEFDLNKNIYKIKHLSLITKTTLIEFKSAFNFVSDITKTSIKNIICNDLDLLYIYIIKELETLGYSCTEEVLKPQTYTFVVNGGKCCNIKFKNKDNMVFRIINHKTKFGIDYNKDLSFDLLEYAIEHNRVGCSLGTDAYNEFVATLLSPKRYMEFVAHKIMRNNDHYPIFNYDAYILEAKENVSGYHVFKRGTFENIFEYDISSSYPAQLLNDMPKGLPKEYKTIEETPKNYFKIIVFSYFNLKPKPKHVEFLNVGTMGTTALTENLFELFKENYNADIKIKKVYAFKTQKSPFKQFVWQNAIYGKLNEKRPHIAKYNKLIANSIIGFFGRNTTVTQNMAKICTYGLEIKEFDKTIEPLYLPVYLCVLDHAKTQFIRTVQKHQDCIIYANTDGFFTNKPLDTELLNINCSLPIGRFRHKQTYAKIYIDCINGYSAITTDGEIENCLAGMSLIGQIDPDQYQQRQFTYYMNKPTPEGEMQKSVIKPH